MSYILQGILLPDCIEHAEQLLRSRGELRELIRNSHELIRIDGKTTMVVNRHRDSMTLPAAVIEDFKSIYDKILIVIWDDQQGVRESVLFDGQESQFFSDSDEEFVELDEEGLPIVDGPRFSKAEIDSYDDDREFETSTNAIELGCRASGVFDPQIIMEFIRKQG